MTRAGSGRPGQDTAGTPHRWILSFVAVILAVLTACPPLAGAEPTGSGNGESTGPKFLKLSLDSVTPTAIASTSDPYFVVSGTVTNIGDRQVDDVSVRIQRAAAVGNPSGLRSALRLDQINYDVTGEFQDVADRLTPGQRKQFSLTIALHSATELPSGISALDITAPGIYPLLLNVNGEPAYGGQARLDDARFLLPVLGIPATAADPKHPAPPPVPATPDAPPVATTMLWPLADRPRLVAGKPGTVEGEALLTDDDLAASLTQGGRLDQLLSALETALEPDGGGDKNLNTSLCLAVDPDLLLTVSDMKDGYKVLASPSDPDGSTRAGTGEHAAKAWLERLRTLAPTMCVVALPFAQVDPEALATTGDITLSDRALNAPADLIDQLLSVKSVRGVALPDTASIDNEGAELLAHHGYSTAILADNAVTPADGRANISSAKNPGTPADSASPDLVRLGGLTLPAPGGGEAAPGAPELHAATFDIWSATALAAVGSHPPTPPFTPDKVRYDVTNDSRAARLQDALGAITWSALNPQPGRPRSALLMPPQQWGPNRDEATALLGQLDLMYRANLAAPRSLTELLAQQVDPQPYDLDYLPAAAAEAVPDHFAEPVRQQAHNLTELMSALVEQPQQELTPRGFLTPLRDDLIRVLTMSDRRGAPALADTTAQRRVDQTTRTVDELFHSVTVLPPGGVYTLASEQSPLLLVARNDLPVAVRIKFRIDAPAETNITDIGEQVLPAKGTRSFQIPTEVSDSRNLAIPIALTTPDGVPLGNAVSVSVRSNAYGRVLAIITASVGALLLLLVARRLWHRFRGQSDPADEGFDSETRRRVNRFRRARKRELRHEEAR
ncbi:hypothetical protein GFY24_02335 [Nocardia sp. SYP-A9097]|uniref:DUF6049 family protein n=1 Tax=Nocardia sp. SYP-A9097 TaxID=2663237 RepID=UPI00129BF180|nr:DUF6049 family protein [Nocardia sp. SYP-A9097]MRH86314.1 hypothetical protein [Nocardia sp. SYP-A9097]